MTKASDLKSSAVAVISASISSLCCLLPLAVVVLGLGSGAFMAVTMKYSAIFIPAGILGTGAGYYLYFREQRRCDRLGCRMVGRQLNLALLVISTLVLGVSVTLTALPDYTAHLIASWSGTAPMDDGMSGPAGQGVGVRAVNPPMSSGDSGETVPVARVTLQVDGMTWGSWPLTVQRALVGLPGIRQADVNFEEGKAWVVYDPSAVTLEQMIRAINQAGFGARALGQR